MPEPTHFHAGGCTKRALILALALVAGAAHADDGWYVTGGVGRAELRHPGDNKWWLQRGWDYTIDQDSTAWKLGGGYRFSRWLAAELTYDDLGKYNHFAGFMAAEDHYDASSPTLCVNGCTPTQWGYLSGHAHAVTLSLLPTLPVARDAALYARLGLARFDASYTVEVTPLDPMARNWQRMDFERRGTAQVFGAGISKGNFYLEATKYRGVKADGSSPYQSAVTYTLGYRWQFN